MVKYKYLICTSSKLVKDDTRIHFNIKHNHEPNLLQHLLFVIKEIYDYLNRCGYIGTGLDLTKDKLYDRLRIYLFYSTHSATFAHKSSFYLEGKCKK